MSEESKLALALRVMRIFDGFDGPSCDSVWWRTDGEYAPVTMIVNCNDLFLWGCADCETITEANFDALEATIAEVATIDDSAVEEGVLLWCCRVRGNRPQPPYYKHLTPALHKLFDACGPHAGVLP